MASEALYIAFTQVRGARVVDTVSGQRTNLAHVRHLSWQQTDLDNFKTVNDRYGHAAGDEVVIALARRVARLIRPSDTVARLHGDELVIFCEDVFDYYRVAAQWWRSMTSAPGIHR